MGESDTSSTFTCSSLLTSPDPDEYDEHIMWNPMLGLFCYVQVGVFMEANLEMVRIALSCRFSLDVPCDKAEMNPRETSQFHAACEWFGLGWTVLSPLVHVVRRPTWDQL